jgi:hypothetical protein
LCNGSHKIYIVSSTFKHRWWEEGKEERSEIRKKTVNEAQYFSRFSFEERRGRDMAGQGRIGQERAGQRME